MILRRLMIALTLLVSFVNTFGIIIESDDMHVICNHISENKRVLILFDIDNTIARTTDILGSDEWNSYKLQELVAQGLSYQEALDIHLPLFFQLTHELDLELVDAKTSLLIAQLQNQNHHVCALTARSHPIKDRTAIQLQNIGINFVGSCPFVAQQYHDTCHCMHGIIFTGGTNKGAALHKVLQAHDHLEYDVVIFVDDKRKYLDEVELMLASYDVEFIGIRYSAADHYIHSYDAALADQLLHAWQSNK